MKKNKKSILLTVCIAVFAYTLGAFWGFPYAELGLTSGNIGRASKQQEQVNSPHDVKLVERYQTDTVYRHKLVVGYGLLSVQTKTTLATLERLKAHIGQVRELKGYQSTIEDVVEVGTQLDKNLNECVKNLNNIGQKQPVSDLGVQLSQSLNMFQIMNNRLAELDSFVLQTQELAKQKKLNDDLLKNYSEFLIETTDIAMSCGDNSRARQMLGSYMVFAMVRQLEPGQAVQNVANSYKERAEGLGFQDKGNLLSAVADNVTSLNMYTVKGANMEVVKGNTPRPHVIKKSAEQIGNQASMMNYNIIKTMNSMITIDPIFPR